MLYDWIEKHLLDGTNGFKKDVKGGPVTVKIAKLWAVKLDNSFDFCGSKVK